MRLTKRVAKFAPSAAWTPSMVTSVGGTSCRTGAAGALTTVTWSGGGPAGGRPPWTVVGYSDGDSGGGLTGAAGRPCATGAGGGTVRRGSGGGGGGGWTGGATGRAGVDQDIVCCAVGAGPLAGGRPPLPRRAPISNVSCGPATLPMLMLCPSWTSITGRR